MVIRVKSKVNLAPTVAELAMKMTKGQYALANQTLQDMNRYVPKREPFMVNTGHISNDGKELIWQTPYSRAQFYGTNGIATFRNYTAPGTGKRWDLKAESVHKGQWVQIVGRAMR